MCWAAGAGAAAAGGGRAAKADLAAARAARRVEWRRNVRACCTRRCETRQVEGMRGMTPCTRLQTARVATRARVCAAPSDPACLVCVKSPSMSVAVLTLRHRVVGLVPLFVTLFHAPRVDPRAVCVCGTRELWLVCSRRLSAAVMSSRRGPLNREPSGLRIPVVPLPQGRSRAGCASRWCRFPRVLQGMVRIIVAPSPNAHTRTHTSRSVR